MKASELMIGDWVLIPTIKEPVQIASLSGIGVWCYVYGKLAGPFVEEHVAPVLITPEILEKNGFVYNELPFVQGWEQFGLTLYRGGKGFRINCGVNVALVIDVVHQLQQALRLCGIEKEIVL